MYVENNLFLMIRNATKFKITVIIQGNIEALHRIPVTWDMKYEKTFLWYSIIVLIHDYDFIIKDLIEELKGHFKCLGKHTEKYITFLVPIKKRTWN